MSVDRFGRHSRKVRAIRGPKGDGFKLTSDGDYDVEGKRIINLGNPKKYYDAVSAAVLRNNCILLEDDVFDAKGKTIGNVGLPSTETDVVTVQYAKKQYFEPLSSMLARHTLSLNSINTELASLKGKVAELEKITVEQELRKFGTLLFHYIQRLHGKDAKLPNTGNPDKYIDWRQLFATPISEDATNIQVSLLK